MVVVMMAVSSAGRAPPAAGQVATVALQRMRSRSLMMVVGSNRGAARTNHQRAAAQGNGSGLCASDEVRVASVLGKLPDSDSAIIPRGGEDLAPDNNTIDLVVVRSGDVVLAGDFEQFLGAVEGELAEHWAGSAATRGKVVAELFAGVITPAAIGIRDEGIANRTPEGIQRELLIVGGDNEKVMVSADAAHRVLALDHGDEGEGESASLLNPQIGRLIAGVAG